MICDALGTRIKSLRTQKNLSQADLAKLASIGRERLSNFERGSRWPTKVQLEHLAQALEVEFDVLVRDTDWLSPEERGMLKRTSARVAREFGRRYDYRPPRDRDMATQLRKALGTYRDVTRWLLSLIREREDGVASLRVLSTVVAGSALEVVAHLFLLAFGTIVWVAPEPLGFRKHPVVNPKTREGVGSQAHPAYRVDLGGLKCLFIPQVGLACRKSTWRVDLLCAVIDPKGVVRWCYVEIDGQGHDTSSDHFRDQDIDLPVIRVFEKDITSESLLERLEERIRKALSLAA